MTCLIKVDTLAPRLLTQRRPDYQRGLILAGACDENLRRRNRSISRLLLAFAAASTVVSEAVAQTATPPSRWGAGDELGMANTLGPATWQRCAQSMANPKATSYEVSYLRSNTMPQS